MNPLRSLLDRQARQRPEVFVAMTLRDESTGARVQLVPFQREIVRVICSAPRGAVECFAEAGKSSLVAPVVAHALASDPTLRVALVSNTLGQSVKQLGGLARLIESPDTQRIFPNLAPGSAWTQHHLSVRDKPGEIRDPNVQAASLDGAGLLGARIDLLVLDDVDSLATTATPAARDQTWRWVVATGLSRLAPGGRVIVLSTTWHKEDVLHRFVALGGVEHVRVPIQDLHRRSAWPARWTEARIAARRRELGPRVAGRVLDCNALSDDACVFDHALVQAMIDRGLAMPLTMFDRPRGRYVVGVDVAFSTSATSDKSAIVVVRVCDDGRREIVHAEAARLDFDSLALRVVEVCNAFGGTAAIESNGGGAFVHEQVRRRAPSVALHTSATSKLARVEMLHAEMSASRWVFRPADGRITDGMRGLADGLVIYSPNEHTPDDVAALLVAVEQLRAAENRPWAGMIPNPGVTSPRSGRPLNQTQVVRALRAHDAMRAA